MTALQMWRGGRAGPVTPRSFTPPPSTSMLLSVSTDNARYFVDASGQSVYLAGSHTWHNGQDIGTTDPPVVFDYDQWLDFIQARGHNFFRLWFWENTKLYVSEPDDYWFTPHPWQRTGPGNANDGKPKFDLDLFNQTYFDRLRDRVIKARQRGMYVAVMLFQGWSVSYPKGFYNASNPYLHHPFHASNNVNGVDGDSNGDNSGNEMHELSISGVTAYQEAYVEKVIDTLNDLDNLLFEISNESTGNTGNEAWHNHFIDFIHDYEAALPLRHPVGWSVAWPDGNHSAMNASAAEWVSYAFETLNPPVADGTKVSVLDIDHACGICYEPTFPWVAFCRGHYALYMDEYDGVAGGDDTTALAEAERTRENVGHVRTYANRMSLLNCVPAGALSSTGFCLANTDVEYLAYRPSGSSNFTLDLSVASGAFNIEWFNPATGSTTSGGTVAGGDVRTLTPPHSGEAVAYLTK